MSELVQSFFMRLSRIQALSEGNHDLLVVWRFHRVASGSISEAG